MSTFVPRAFEFYKVYPIDPACLHDLLDIDDPPLPSQSQVALL